MGKKKRTLDAVKRNNQDILPTQIAYTPEMKQKIKDILGIEDKIMDEILGNHIKYLFPDDKVRTDKKRGIQYDVWGVGWDLVLTEGFHIREHPLAGSGDLRQYLFPVPDEKLLSPLSEIETEEKNNYFILFDQGWTLFERSWLLRNFIQLL